MADQSVSIFSGMLKRLKDMMNGTFAEVVVAARLNVYQAIEASGIGVLAPLATVVVDGVQRANIEIQVKGGALTALQVLCQYHPSGSWQMLYSTSTDFVVPLGLLVGASRSDGGSDLTATPAGASAFLILDVAGMYALQLRGSSAGASATVLMGGQ